MKRALDNTNLELLKIICFWWVVTIAFASSGQISSDLNRHIRTDESKEKIVYTALKKGYISLKAEIKLVDGVLRCPDNQKFEDIFLAPLLSRYQKNGERFYKNYAGLFYLFIESAEGDVNTLEALEKVLEDYRGIVANTKWNTQ